MNGLPHPLARLVARAALLGLLLLVGACSTLRPGFVKQPSSALPAVADTPATRYLNGQVAAHPGQSGFRALPGGSNALMSRIALADSAQYSIDLQYYIFANDSTGRLLAQHVLAAADRGVRVRILLDDLDVSKEDRMLDALDAHANIEVRLFNPFSIRDRSIFSKMGQFVFEGRRLNRRMHNKSFIVDGMQAIVGGRNIGDAYFNAGEDVHFRDLDVIAIGPVVPQVAAMFDRYWNSYAAYPVTAFSGTVADDASLARLRDRLAHDARTFEQSDYAQAVADDLPDGSSAERKGAWSWGVASLVADDPDKADPDMHGKTVLIAPDLKKLLDVAAQQALLISPYFIPGEQGTAYLRALAGRGVDVRVLTNSLSATDEPEVHSGYSRYREPLLAAGVQLYELRPIQGKQPRRAYGRSSGVSLHAKSLVVDHRHVFIGSMNFDPRSRLVNTEMGVIVDCPELAAVVERFFERATIPENAFHVTLDTVGGRKVMHWTAVDDGKAVQYEHDPDTSWLRRTEVGFMRLLPIEGLL